MEFLRTSRQNPHVGVAGATHCIRSVFKNRFLTWWVLQISRWSSDHFHSIPHLLTSSGICHMPRFQKWTFLTPWVSTIGSKCCGTMSNWLLSFSRVQGYVTCHGSKKWTFLTPWVCTIGSKCCGAMSNRFLSFSRVQGYATCHIWKIDPKMDILDPLGVTQCPISKN